MNITLFVSMLFGLQLLYWLTGLRASKNLKGKEDYFLADKSVRFFPLMMTFLATQVGGGGILGAADEAYRSGWPVLLYPLGMALGLILLGCGIGRKLTRFQVSTVAQIFEIVYGSKVLKKIASLLSIISLFMILVSQIIASSKFLVSLGLNSTLLFILFWAIVILYTVQGGLRAVISTDRVQALFFSAIFFLCFGWIAFSEPSVSLIQFPQLEQFANVSSKLSGWLVTPLLFMIIGQDMGQRCFAGSSPQIVSRAAFWAGIGTLTLCTIPVFLGTLAKAVDLAIPEGGSVLMTIIATTTNPWMTALTGCAVLAAVISTATSQINAISSNLSNDFKLSFLEKMEPIRAVRGMTCLISLSAIFFAFYFDNIVDLLIQSYELSVSCLFVPIWMALSGKPKRMVTALTSIIFGGIGFVFFRIYPIEISKEIASLALSALGFLVGTWIAQYQKEEKTA